MDAKELMIGDWVLHNGIPKTVDVIWSKAVSLNNPTKVWGSIYADKFNEEEIEPIPLTTEILEKNGFVANKHVYPYPYYEYINKEDKLKIGFAFPQGNRTSYKESWVYIDSERVFVEHLPCIYAHELQHALRLCGVDKEITI